MKALRRFARRLTASVLGRREDDRIREELAEHLRLLTDDNVRAGLSFDEARRRASIKLGVGETIAEAHRDEQRLRWLEDMAGDVRYGVRTLPMANAIQHLLFGIEPHDSATFGGAGGTLLLATLLASAIPAYRATRIDPLRALRAE